MTMQGTIELPAVLALFNFGFGELFAGAFCFIWPVVFILTVLGWWKLFEKAGQPGWAAIVPIYNLYVLVTISGKEIWWMILYFVPCLGFIAHLIVCMEVAKRFGKDAM